MARKAHAPTDKTRAEVSALAGFGVREDEIAVYIGIDPKTLRKHYRGELDTGHIKANAKVARTLYRHATGEAQKDGATAADTVRAAMFWMKARGGWSEKQEVEHSGEIKTTAPTINITRE